MISGQFRVGDTRHTVSDIAALNALGWTAEIPLERTIERYIEWIQPFQGTRDYLEAAESAMRYWVIPSLATTVWPSIWEESVPIKMILGTATAALIIRKTNPC